MGIKRLAKKYAMGGGDFIRGHVVDAYIKKTETGKSFTKCLVESVKETVAEDMPGTNHIYQIGESDGRKKGTIEQARRDEKKCRE